MMIVCILIICHLLADFYLQPSKMVQKKESSIAWVSFHSVIYLILFSVVCFTLLSWKYAFIILLIISISHFIIDFIKSLIERKVKQTKARLGIYLIDQLLHITIIVIANLLFNLKEHTMDIYDNLFTCSKSHNFILYFLLTLILLNPTAILIKKILLCIKTEKIDNVPCTNKIAGDNTVNIHTVGHIPSMNTGNIIGQLERIIISIFILIGQYGVVGLVLTAKSIARFKQLEDKNFAEYYLIGTLFSILISVLATLIVKSVLI